MDDPVGATVYDLYKNRAILTLQGAELIAIGFVVAFVCALFVVRTLVGFVSRHGFGVFAWYRINRQRRPPAPRGVQVRPSPTKPPP